MNLTIHHGDNLDTLRALVERGERFDLVELDGPYGAGLEGWDVLSEAEYVAHYAARLALVRRVLQPWGVCYLFGYPEMVAEVKAWAHATNTLYCRRWLTWYVNSTAHAGRRVQVIAVFTQQSRLPSLTDSEANICAEFRGWLKARRREMGLTVVQCHQQTGISPNARGGYVWFESDSCTPPRERDYAILKRFFGVPDKFDVLPSIVPVDLMALDNVTDLDYIVVPVERAAELNDNGLRSKPLGLYDRLFRPVVPPRETKRALVLYGGSGNAAIAAGRLGYAVDVCETDAGRCDLIRRRYAWGVERRDETPVSDLGPLFAGLDAA